jgi:tetratricopeptide (TPR) repeat protein
MAIWAPFDARLVELTRRPFSDELKVDIESFIASLPAIESLAASTDKAELLLRKGRARLLLPQVSKETEADLNKALKFTPENPDVWLAMSEALWKRNAPQEARDALSSALRVNPNHVASLAQQSRILRTLSAQCSTTEERLRVLEESISSAKAAVAADMNDGEAWSALGVAMLQLAVTSGLNVLTLRKSLAALNKAAAAASWNADIFYNRGVVHRATGRYALAVDDFRRAFALDPRGLSGAKTMANATQKLLTDIVSASARLAERDAKKLTSKVASSKGDRVITPLKAIASAISAGQTVTSSVAIVGLLSPPGDQPLAFLVLDKEATPATLLVSSVTATAFKSGDVVTLLLPPAQFEDVVQSISASDAAAEAPSSFTTTIIHADPSHMFVNGTPLPAAELRATQLTTRQFQ